MNFKWKNGLLFVPLKLVYNGELFIIKNCILDTGSASTAIDIDLVPFDYNKPTALDKIYGIGGGQEVASQKVDKLIVDGFEFSDLEIEYRKCDSRTVAERNTRIHGNGGFSGFRADGMRTDGGDHGRSAEVLRRVSVLPGSGETNLQFHHDSVLRQALLAASKISG
jgi:hypothetical protein